MRNIKTLGLTGLAALVFALAGCGTQGSTGRNPAVNQDGNGSQIKDSGYKTDAEQDVPDGRIETRDGSVNDYDAGSSRTDGNDSRDAQVIEEQDASDNCIEYCEVRDGGDSPDASDLDAGQDGGELDSGFDSGYRIDGGNERDAGSSRTDGGNVAPYIEAGPDMTLVRQEPVCIQYACDAQTLASVCTTRPFAPGHSAEGFPHGDVDGQIVDWHIDKDHINQPGLGFSHKGCASLRYNSTDYSIGQNLSLYIEVTDDKGAVGYDTAQIILE